MSSVNLTITVGIIHADDTSRKADSARRVPLSDEVKTTQVIRRRVRLSSKQEKRQMMDKEKVKEQLGVASAKAKDAFAEIKDNFKADEGTTGFRKVQSMFVNLWKSGTTGKGALIACSVAVLLLLCMVFSGGDKSGAASGGGTAEVASGESARGTRAAVAKKARRPVPTDTLVVKGLYMRMPGDDAVEACKKMIASSDDLVVVDFRNGIEREKDETTKSNEKKAYEEAVRMAEADVEKFLKWANRENRGYDPKAENFCAERVGDLALHVQKEGDIKGNFPLGAAAELADKYGYQMEWMLPGRNTLEPQTVGSFVVHGIEASKGNVSKGKGNVSKGKGNVSKGKGNAKVSISRHDTLKSQIRGYSSNNYPEIARPVLAAKGLEPLPILSKDKVWFRLTLNDAAGKPVTKTKLVEAFLRLAKLRTKGELASVQIKEIAEKYVDSFLQWVELNGNHAYFMNKSYANHTGKSVSSVVGAEIDNTSDQAIMISLAMDCRLKVEWGVPARLIKPEEVIETVTIPANGKSMRDAMNMLDSDKDRERLLESKGFGVEYHRAWMRLVLKTTNGVEVAKEEVVKNWLAVRGYYPPSDKLTIAKKNLIKIAIKDEGTREDQLDGLCFVWIDDQDNVKEVYFNETGMNRLFNAADLSCEEFAKSLVNNYSEIPSLVPDVKRENPGRGTIQTTTWTHKNPRGYQVELFERAYFNNNGVKYNETMLKRDVEVAMALSLVDKLPKKYFTVVAIQSESARKFD